MSVVIFNRGPGWVKLEVQGKNPQGRFSPVSEMPLAPGDSVEVAVRNKGRGPHPPYQSVQLIPLPPLPRKRKVPKP